MRAWLTRGRLWLISVVSGGGVLVLEGCDPSVRDEVLSGVGTAATGLATTFINAFFQGLVNDAEEEAAVVRAFLEHVPQFFC